MQEEVENRTLNLAISTTKLSGRALLAAFRKYMQHRRNVKAKKLAVENEKPVGEQTIDQLLGQNQGATNIEIEKTDIKGFKRFLDKYGIDYSPASARQNIVASSEIKSSNEYTRLLKFKYTVPSDRKKILER